MNYIIFAESDRYSFAGKFFEDRPLVYKMFSLTFFLDVLSGKLWKTSVIREMTVAAIFHLVSVALFLRYYGIFTK